MDTELPTISKGQMAAPVPENQGRGRRGVWQRRTALEKALMGVCGVALLACVALVGVVATSSYSSSSSSTASLAAPAELMPQAKPLVFVQDKKDAPPPPTQEIKKDPPSPVQVTTGPAKSSRLPVLKGTLSGGKEVEVCNTVECTLAAASIIEAMDSSVDPCDNFYQFACGGWMNVNPVPDDSSRWAQFDVLDRELSNALSTILTEPIGADDPHPIAKSKIFYESCMNETHLEEVGLTPLTDFLDQFGGWPMATSEWDESSFDWQLVMAESKVQTAADYLVNVWVFADQKDTFTTAIYMDQTSLGMPRSVLVQMENYEERVAAYKTYITTTAELIAKSLGQTVDAAQLKKDVEDLLKFEEELAEITSPAEDRRDIDRMYNPMTVEELSKHTGLDWLHILSDMFSPAGVTVNAATRLIVQEPQYIHNMTDLMSSTNARIISNYLMWRHVKSLGGATTRSMRDAAFQYDMVANGVSAEEPRNIQCANEANTFLGMAIGTEYVKTYFSQQAKDEANAMVEDLREAFKILLEVNEWMDAETKPKAIEKANAISKFIGYPDWYGNETALETFYEGLGDMHESTYFVNVLAVEGWSAREELSDFGKPSKRDRWFSPPTIVNAYYMPEYNSITFPAGILQPPFYRSNSLMALNYGGIGQVIGHEITHGFDDQGRQNDKDGNALPWWTNETLEAFQTHAQCIVDQYGSIRLPELDDHLPNATLNGINTQGENIADNGGLREALLAYQLYVERFGEEPRLPGLTEYSPMQLFFLNNANIWCTSTTMEGLLNQVLTDPHSPAKFRVLVPMLNMKEFSEIWSCPSGSGMNPEHKCQVW
ncbi:neprilysin-1-like isoform X2 [Scylla paramamosain]